MRKLFHGIALESIVAGCTLLFRTLYCFNTDVDVFLEIFILMRWVLPKKFISKGKDFALTQKLFCRHILYDKSKDGDDGRAGCTVDL